MAWSPFRTAKAAGMPSVPMSISCGARSAACWCTRTSRPRSSSAWAARSTRSITTWARTARAPTAWSGMTLQGSGGTRGTLEAARREIARFIEQAAAEAARAAVPLPRSCWASTAAGRIPSPASPPTRLWATARTCWPRWAAPPCWPRRPRSSAPSTCWCKRARNREVAEKLLGCIRKYKEYLARFEGSFDDNPSPGNKEGGLSNILEKSLGAVAKGGTAP